MTPIWQIYEHPPEGYWENWAAARPLPAMIKRWVESGELLAMGGHRALVQVSAQSRSAPLPGRSTPGRGAGALAGSVTVRNGRLYVHT